MSLDADGHLTIPAWTTTIVFDSWAEWGLSDWEVGRRITVRSVTIPDSVHTIGERVFQGCTALVNVTIPTSVTSLGCAAFHGCASLVNVSIPNSVISIERSTFQNCIALVGVRIPTGVTTIGPAAFAGCTSLASISMQGGNVKTIGVMAFHLCTNLRSVSIPASVTMIEPFAFDTCPLLAIISISASAPTIKHGVFQGCSSLTTLLVQPVNNGAAVPACTWRSTMLLEAPTKLPPTASDAGDPIDEEMALALQSAPWLPHITRIWAPDDVIKLVAGPFAACSSFAEVPHHLRAAPAATTWAAVQLWMWWSPPTGAGFTEKGRGACRSRQAMVFNTILAGFRTATAEALPYLPQELWVTICGHVEHNQPPTYRDDGASAGRIASDR